jgi:two-component system chemotaxis response regulator CheB
MNSMIRVLIADDSPTARALLVAILSSDPDIQVVGEACNGAEAVELTRKLRPDVITMDLRMPVMDGFEATKEIMIAVPTPIVIVTASFEAREMDVTMNALRAGAVAAVQKPPGSGAPAFDEAVRELLTTVKAMALVKVVRHWRPAQATGPVPARSAARSGARGKVVAIATSTGGPAALHHLLSKLPAGFPAPILVVQHITSGFTAGLAHWLNQVSAFHVKIAQEGETLAPGTVYLAPDSCHLGVTSRHRIALSNAPPVGGFRPSGTFLFESVAQTFGPATVAVILTGMGEDGVEGLRAVHQAGGTIIAQDEKTSVVFGMPAAAIAAGLTDLVVPLDVLPARLEDLV